jgi:hypothetical protein
VDQTGRDSLFSGEQTRKASTKGGRYEIVLSFAGEDRALANEIAEKLTRRGISVFYDEFERAVLWGTDLFEYLTDIHQNRGRYCLALVSENYKKKRWTRLEWRAVQARCFLEDSDYCLPVRLDNTELPGLFLQLATYLSRTLMSTR